MKTESTALEKVTSDPKPQKPKASRAKGHIGISGLYCSDLGKSFTNAEIYEINEKLVFDKIDEASRKLYKKLLLNNPDRVRHFVRDYEKIVQTSSTKEKADYFHEISCKLMEDAAFGVLNQTGIDPKEIDFIVVNYMAGKTLPSLSSHLAGRLELRTDVVNVNMSDMGCSAAVAAMDLGLRLLKSEDKAKRVLMIALEPVSNLFQSENDSGAIVGNTLFGEGCAAVVMSSHKEEMLYHIDASQRVLHADEKSVDAIKLAWNEHGPMIQLSREISSVAGKAIEDNLRRLVPQFLSVSDKAKYVATKKVPKWQKKIDWWAIHPGGTSILRGFQKQLKLADADLGPSYRVFQERSNMSSPSVLYALNNIEKRGPKVGDRILMASFGSGFKVNSMILRKGKKRIYERPEKFAVVIGGTSGIGLDSAKKLIADGYHTFIGSRRIADPKATYERLENATYIPLDVTDTKSIEAFTKQVWQKSWGIDALVVSSGIAPAGALQGRQDSQEIIRTVQTNLTGAMVCVNMLMPKMRRFGKVVLLNSILGQIPLMGNAAYCASKAGLRHFGECLEIELKRSGRKVTVHNLYPAYVETPMLGDVQSSSKTFLRPIQPAVVTNAVSKIVNDPNAGTGKGFVLWRDQVIAYFYRYLPGSFKQVLASI